MEIRRFILLIGVGGVDGSWGGVSIVAGNVLKGALISSRVGVGTVVVGFEGEVVVVVDFLLAWRAEVEKRAW